MQEQNLIFKFLFLFSLRNLWQSKHDYHVQVTKLLVLNESLLVPKV